ncbi:uncharacterized protein C8Q71DRAFT_51545 [Rhodofomes roseus]|uniref:Uncharacterized protein n=1 Tax=Rhodofomes roseus TaxID=34475 RepID=A0ABQ8KH27_9APHY|nr:uncharacterized protein C8Q71DRAFT_51545 [Rhodofomes roseus]KAH9836643.1 hypothetical protein C8Q71DRAFT_51545 [Rhodofomes roseus]
MSHMDSANTSGLPADAVERCTKVKTSSHFARCAQYFSQRDGVLQEARKDGIFAGFSAGLVGAILGSKVFRLNRNTTIVCGVLTGALSGWQFTQGFRTSKLASLRAELALRKQSELGVTTTSPQKNEKSS